MNDEITEIKREGNIIKIKIDVNDNRLNVAIPEPPDDYRMGRHIIDELTTEGEAEVHLDLNQSFILAMNLLRMIFEATNEIKKDKLNDLKNEIEKELQKVSK